MISLHSNIFKNRLEKSGYKSLAALFLAVIMIITAVLSVPMRAYADDYDYEYQRNLMVCVDSNDGVYNVKYIDMYYDNNTYVSLRDMAVALSGTRAAFDLLIEKDGIRFTKGAAYSPLGGEGALFTELTRDKDSDEYVRRRNYFYMDGATRHYYTFIYKDKEAGYYDCFMYLSDLLLILDVNAWYSEGVLNIDTSSPLSIEPREMEKNGYFLGTNSVLVGDATNGEVYYSYCPDKSVPMASTTKLMSYIVAMDALTRGELSLGTVVETSENVEKLSHSIDRAFVIKTGTAVTVEELLYGMLLPSNNELTLTLAEAVAGSEKAFVKRMNDKAAAIGLSEGTKFFTCNGLPVYTEDAFQGKVQNHITANDMFRLVCYLLSTYPQVTEITSSTGKFLPSLDRWVYNTNPMLYNLSGVVGLKTGTTNKAGSCLVSAISVSGDKGRHTIVSIELGAEDIITRNNVSQTMLTYGARVYKNGGASSIPVTDSESESSTAVSKDDLIVPLTEEIPETADELARLIVWTARNHLPLPEPELIDAPEGAE